MSPTAIACRERITFDQYRAIDAVNWSSLKHLQRSPLHYRHVKDHGDGESTSRMMGRALHALVLQPDEDLITVFDGTRRGAAWEAFKAANVGKTIVKPDELRLVEAQADAVLSHEIAASLFRGGGITTETPIVWTDEATGLRCKGLPDAAGRGFVADLKGGPALPEFERLAFRMGYHLQIAFYRRGIAALTGEAPDCFVVAVESTAPHDVGVYAVSQTLLALADRDLSAMLATLKNCMDEDRWPGRYPGMVPMDAPGWMLDEIEIPDGGIVEVEYDV